MSDSIEKPDAAGSDQTLVSIPREPEALRGVCAFCRTPLIADPERKGVNICPKCHTIQKAASRDFPPGSVVGDYRILKKMAQGGMGVIYLCCPLNDLSRRLVLKTLRLELGENQEVYARRFKRESELLSRLQHPTIVQMYDSWSDEDNAYIIMEYIDGHTLESIRKQDLYIFDEAVVIQIMTVLAEALDYAWEQLKLLHRDIKPSNIMFDNEGHLHLLDFGIAKSLEAEESTVLTITGLGLGTPGYMSPEQFRNATQPDCTTDIYSLGATMYFLITGEPPFVGENPSVVFSEMLRKDPVPLHKRNPEISENFSMLIQQTLDRNPKKRPFSWKKLLVNLERVAQGRPPLIS